MTIPAEPMQPMSSKRSNNSNKKQRPSIEQAFNTGDNFNADIYGENYSQYTTHRERNLAQDANRLRPSNIDHFSKMNSVNPGKESEHVNEYVSPYSILRASNPIDVDSTI